MQQIPIQALPNQSFSVQLDGNQWDWTIELVNDAIAVTLSLNGNIVISGLSIVGGMRIIPSEYEESGNFVLVTMNQQVPDYTQFGTGQQLIYLSAVELMAIRVPAPPILTPAYFDLNAALPLRIFPQGYVLATGYETESPANYIDESGNQYIDESGADNYVSETNPIYVAEDGVSQYFADGGS